MSRLNNITSDNNNENQPLLPKNQPSYSNAKNIILFQPKVRPLNLKFNLSFEFSSNGLFELRGPLGAPSLPNNRLPPQPQRKMK